MLQLVQASEARLSRRAMSTPLRSRLSKRVCRRLDKKRPNPGAAQSVYTPVVTLGTTTLDASAVSYAGVSVHDSGGLIHYREEPGRVSG